MPTEAMNPTENHVRHPASRDDFTSSSMDAVADEPLQWIPDVPGPTRRWWVGVGVAALFALPLAWLLSYAAALPFFIGLFFFMLFGLMIGAAAFRVSAPGRPYATFPLVLGTTLLVACTWGFSLVKEARDFPDDVARRVSLHTRDIGDRSVAEFRCAVASDVRAWLADRYGPGHVWGYVRWVLTNGELKRGELPTLNKAVSMPAAQISGWWAFRVVASVALLGFGVSSQTLLLRVPRDKRTRLQTPTS
jgi:hypothetical protein